MCSLSRSKLPRVFISESKDSCVLYLDAKFLVCLYMTANIMCSLSIFKVPCVFISDSKDSCALYLGAKFLVYDYLIAKKLVFFIWVQSSLCVYI